VRWMFAMNHQLFCSRFHHKSSGSNSSMADDHLLAVDSWSSLIDFANGQLVGITKSTIPSWLFTRTFSLLSAHHKSRSLSPISSRHHKVYKHSLYLELRQ
jgi:hypothetical protein